jgi:hypothetical protein
MMSGLCSTLTHRVVFLYCYTVTVLSFVGAIGVYKVKTIYCITQTLVKFGFQILCYTVVLICYYFWRLYLYLGIKNTVQLCRFYHYLRRCHMDTLSTYNITRHWEMFWTWWSQILLWDNYKYIHVVIKTFTAHDASLE